MARMMFPQYARGRDGIELVAGQTVLDHIRQIGGVEIDAECGGRGTCGKDVIRVDRGAEYLTGITKPEKALAEAGVLKSGRRLACQARVAEDKHDISVFIPDFGKYTILTESLDTGVELAPCVSVADGRVVYHTGTDLGPYRGKLYGVAIDVGTTTLVMQVVDLETGKNIGKPMASKNPQIAYGNDIISRIGYTIDNADGLEEIQSVVVDGINKTLAELERQLGAEADSIRGYIYDVVAVGNSTMRSIFFGQDVRDLGLIPFEPASKAAVTTDAARLGLAVHPQAQAYGPFLIGGHAGADCLADIISTKLYERDEITMIVDIGTNGEVVIGNKDRIITASCAAGGAYEGYQIRCGVGAIEGAITSLKIENGKVQCTTLGNKPPLGLCGSGVIDLLAELARNHIVNERARLKHDYNVTDGVSVCQDDINQLIIAKAGLRTDQDLVIKYFGTTLEDVEKIYLAGAFGNYMNIANAVRIGLLPRADESKFVRFGNGALAGARDMLLSSKRRSDSENLAGLIEHTKPNEIEGEAFQYMVADRMYFDN